MANKTEIPNSPSSCDNCYWCYGKLCLLLGKETPAMLTGRNGNRKCTWAPRNDPATMKKLGVRRTALITKQELKLAKKQKS